MRQYAACLAVERRKVIRREGWRLCKNLSRGRGPGQVQIECRDECTHGEERALPDLITFVLVKPQCNGRQAHQGRSSQDDNDPNQSRLDRTRPATQSAGDREYARQPPKNAARVSVIARGLPPLLACADIEGRLGELLRATFGLGVASQPSHRVDPPERLGLAVLP